MNPLNDRVLVRRIAAQSMSKGGLHIPEVGKEKAQEATVIAVGPGARHPQTGERMALAVKKGDRVVFGKYSGAEVRMDEEPGEYLVMREDDILGVVP